MKALLILAVVAAVLLLIGCIDLVFWISAGDRTELAFSILCFKIKLHTQPGQKKPKEKEKPLPSQESGKEPEEESSPLVSSVREGVDLVRELLSPVGKFIRRIRICRLNLSLSVGGEDAAAAAVRYGRCQALVHLSLTALRQHFSVKVRRIVITPDFFSEKVKFHLDFQVRIRIGAVVTAAFRGLAAFLQYQRKRKKDKKTIQNKNKVQEGT